VHCARKLFLSVNLVTIPMMLFRLFVRVHDGTGSLSLSREEALSLPVIVKAPTSLVRPNKASMAVLELPSESFKAVEYLDEPQ